MNALKTMNPYHFNSSSCLAKFLRNVSLIIWLLSITLTVISANLQDDYIPLSQENESRFLDKDDRIFEEMPLYQDRRNDMMGSNEFVNDITQNIRARVYKDGDGSQSVGW